MSEAKTIHRDVQDLPVTRTGENAGVVQFDNDDSFDVALMNLLDLRDDQDADGDTIPWYQEFTA